MHVLASFAWSCRYLKLLQMIDPVIENSYLIYWLVDTISLFYNELMNI